MPRRTTRAKSQGILAAANRILLVVGATGIVVMMIHIVVNALMRSVNDDPLTGTNEYVAYWYMPVVAFFGFIVAQRDRSHTEARVLFDRMPRTNKIEVQIAGLLLTAAMCAGFAYYGWLEAWHSWEIGLTGGVTGVVIWPMTFLAPVTYAVLVVQILTEIALVLRQPGRVETSAEEVSDARI